jgi:hypothetical protein
VHVRAGIRSGVNFFNNELNAKRLEFLRQLVSTAMHVAVLVNPTNPENSDNTLREVEAVAHLFGCRKRFPTSGTRAE